MPFLKNVVTDFSGTVKARKLKVCINMDNDWMYCVYWNRGQGSIFLGRFSISGAILDLPCPSMIQSFRNSVTAKLKCILLYNFYVCSPTTMKLILHLVSEVSKV